MIRCSTRGLLVAGAFLFQVSGACPVDFGVLPGPAGPGTAGAPLTILLGGSGQTPALPLVITSMPGVVIGPSSGSSGSIPGAFTSVVPAPTLTSPSVITFPGVAPSVIPAPIFSTTPSSGGSLASQAITGPLSPIGLGVPAPGF
jgi:hypothetical protein